MAERKGRGSAGRQRLPALGAVVLAMVASLALIYPGPAASVEPGPLAYASCSPDDTHHTEITHICHQGDQIRAVLRYSARPLDYRVCLRFSEGPTRCESERRVEPGTSSIVTLSSQNFVGLLRVSWQSESREIASWNIRFVKDPVVPAFGISPLIVSGTHRLFGLLIRHIPAGLRARAWGCGGSCPLALRLTADEGETRRYRIVEPARHSNFALGDLLYVQVDAPGRQYRGTRLWGRLYRGKLVRDRDGRRGDTAIRRIKPNLCTPPGKSFRRATGCANVPSSSTVFRRL